MSPSRRRPLTSLTSFPAKRGRKFSTKKLEELKEIHRLQKIVASTIAKPTPTQSSSCPCQRPSVARAQRHIFLPFNLDYLDSSAFVNKYPNQNLEGWMSICLPDIPAGRDFSQRLERSGVFEQIWPILQRASMLFSHEIEDTSSPPESKTTSTTPPHFQADPACLPFQVYAIGTNGQWHPSPDTAPLGRLQFKFPP